MYSYVTSIDISAVRSERRPQLGTIYSHGSVLSHRLEERVKCVVIHAQLLIVKMTYRAFLQERPMVSILNAS